MHFSFVVDSMSCNRAEFHSLRRSYWINAEQ